MIKREELHRLVFVILETKERENLPTARQLYEEVKDKEPQIIREEHIKSFKSFVKVVNSFTGIECMGNPPRVYKVNDRVVKKLNL